MIPAPMVRVVVVNFNGGDLTIDCLRSLQATVWPAPRLQVMLVDNDSTDGVAARVRAELPGVAVLEAGSNLGFGGGCNLALRDLGDVEYVALINPDATVDPHWLTPLVSALSRDPELGAASPKILLAPRFFDLSIQSETRARGRGDRRALGVRYSGLRVEGIDVTRESHLASGTWGIEPGGDREDAYQWTSGRGVLLVPVAVGRVAPIKVDVRLSADVPTRVVLVSSTSSKGVTVGCAPEWFELVLDGVPYDVINSTGSILVAGGFGADRGYLEADYGQYDSGDDVPAWSGAGVLLSRSYLDDVGLFDERFFLYYEDFDLAWRGRARGWRYRYVPGSVIRHMHSASTNEGSLLFAFHNERNRLLTLSRNASLHQTAKAAARSLVVSASFARRDLLSPILHGRRPRPEIVYTRLRAFLSFLSLLPGSLRLRRIR